MKKTFKIIGIIAGVIIFFVGILGYVFWRSGHQLRLLQQKADYIVENLDQPDVIEKFPTKYFPKSQLQPILAGIRQNCDWKNKDGKFVDFFTEKNIGGIDQNSFIYEYYLNCDSLRFILTFNVEDEPELMGFRVEPLEEENKMILFPEKQLRNR